jgi:hypothetical protein
LKTKFKPNPKKWGVGCPSVPQDISNFVLRERLNIYIYVTRVLLIEEMGVEHLRKKGTSRKSGSYCFEGSADFNTQG